MGKKRSSKKKRARTPPNVALVKVDRALKRKWASLMKIVARSAREDAEAFDARYEAIGEIIDGEPPAYLAGGFATEKDFFRSIEEDERTGRAWVRVARFASPKEIERFKRTKLDEMLTYLEAKMGGPPKGRVPVDFDKLRFRVERDGEDVTVSADDVSVRELKSLTRELTRGTRTPGRSKAVIAVEKALKAAKVKDFTVRKSGGRIVVGVAPSQWRAAAGAIAKLKLDED